jgi:hypothetical protein
VYEIYSGDVLHFPRQKKPHTLSAQKRNPGATPPLPRPRSSKWDHPATPTIARLSAPGKKARENTLPHQKNPPRCDPPTTPTEVFRVGPSADSDNCPQLVAKNERSRPRAIVGHGGWSHLEERSFFSSPHTFTNRICNRQVIIIEKLHEIVRRKLNFNTETSNFSHKLTRSTLVVS